MESITLVSQALRTLCFEDASREAARAGSHQAASPVFRHQFAVGASARMAPTSTRWSQPTRAICLDDGSASQQTSHCRTLERIIQLTGARCDLEKAVSALVLGSPLVQGLLARFPAVILEDASSVQLPDALAFLWKGNGGSGSASAVKLGVRWDIRSGQLQGPLLQDGKSNETHNPVHALSLAVGGV
jgi:hypothetical protein